MYPPSDEPENVRAERSRAQAHWVILGLYLFLGLGEILTGHRSKGAMWLVIVAFFVADLLLEKNGAPKRLRLWLGLAGVAVTISVALLVP